MTPKDEQPIDDEIDEDIDIDEDDDEEDDLSEVHTVGDVSVGGGPSRTANMVVLAVCIFGVLYGLLHFLNAQ